MKQDLRELFRKERSRNRPALQEGHHERFAELLEQELPLKKDVPKVMLWKIAAAMLVLLGIGGLFYQSVSEVEQPEVVNSPPASKKDEVVPDRVFELREVAPEFEKIENFYLANLNIELAKLDVNDRNRGMIDSFIKQLSGLDEEYQKLNEELYQFGANSQTLEAMVANLQFRLELLLQVKERIENNKRKMNERYEDVTI